ncbi:Zonadhesin [Trichinella spiralis]|uniref:Zonadhesin n=1 Tax=Trichinella spiralis TaxID=6334 RepID=A0ABR3KRF5_TRISP
MENGMNLKVQFFNELMAIVEVQIRQSSYVGVVLAVKNGNLPFALNEKEFDVLKEHMQQFYREGPYKMDNVSGVVTRCADYQAEEMFREKIDKNQAASAAGQPIKSRRLCNRLQRVRRCMSRRQILCVKCLNKMINSEKDLETPTNKRASTTKPKNTPPRKKKNKQKTTEVDSPSKNLERQVADVEFTGVTATVTADTITTTTVTTASVVTTVTTTAATATITTATVVPSEINAENVESEISTNDEPQPIQAEVETEILVVDDDEARDKVVEEQSEPVLLDVVPENPSIPKQNVEQETFSVPKKSARKSLTEICSELTTKKLELQAAMEVGQQPKLPEATAVQLNSNDDNRLIEIIEQPLPKTKDGVEQEVNDLPSMELENVDIVTIPDVAVNEPNDDQASTEIVIVEEMDTVSIPNVAVHESNDDQASTEIVIVEEMDTVSIPNVAVNEPNDDQASTEIVIVEEMDTVSIPNVAVHESNDGQASAEIVIVEEMNTVSTPTLNETSGDLALRKLAANAKMNIASNSNGIEQTEDVPSTELVTVERSHDNHIVDLYEPSGGVSSAELAGNEKMDVVANTDELRGDVTSAELAGNEKMDAVTGSNALAVRNEQLTSSRPKRNLNKSHSKLNCPCCANVVSVTSVKEGDLVWARRSMHERNYWPAKVSLLVDNTFAIVEIFEMPPIEIRVDVEFIEPFRNSFRKYYNPNKNMKFQKAVALAILQTEGEIYRDRSIGVPTLNCQECLSLFIALQSLKQFFIICI